MTSVAERIGLDIGSAPAGRRRVQAAADAGARLVRLSFPLGDRIRADDGFLDAAREAVEAARAARLAVLGVIDGGLTVAPGGAGAWSDDAPSDLAAAWAEELAGNAGRLVGALEGRVLAWEILPAPNQRVDDTARMAPARWAAILAEAAAAVRAADAGATIVCGGLVSDETADGVAYLRQAAQAGRWAEHGAPFDALGLVLRVAPEGGSSESIVKTLVSERAQRLWRAAVALLGDDELAGLWVTSVAWDAIRAGESAQARNLWTTCDTLTADPRLRAVVWSGLVDTEGATGLYASPDLAPDSRRPAWTAFNDFAVYAAQIGAAAGASRFAWAADEDDGEGEGERAREGHRVADRSDESEDAGTVDVDSEIEVDRAVEVEHEIEVDRAVDVDVVIDVDRTADVDRTTDVGHEIVVDRAAVVDHSVEVDHAAEVDRAVDIDVVIDVDRTADVDRTTDVAHELEVDRAAIVDHAAEVDHEIEVDRAVDVDVAIDLDRAHDVGRPTPAADGRVAFRVPRINELLREAGLTGEALETALDAVAARYGSRDWLPAGDYEIELPAPTPAPARAGTSPADAAPASDGPTNQAVLSAFYRAAGGAWGLLAKAGLDLADLVTARGEPYAGPDIDALDGLEPAEIQAVLRELHGSG